MLMPLKIVLMHSQYCNSKTGLIICFCKRLLTEHLNSRKLNLKGRKIRHTRTELRCIKLYALNRKTQPEFSSSISSWSVNGWKIKKLAIVSLPQGAALYPVTHLAEASANFVCRAAHTEFSGKDVTPEEMADAIFEERNSTVRQTLP